MALTSPADVQRRLNSTNRLARPYLSRKGRYVAPRPVWLSNPATVAAIHRVHAASLRRSEDLPVQSGPDKQKSPEGRTSEDFTNRSNSGRGVDGGRYRECA